MMAIAMGVSPDDEDTLDRACDLGMAFQLAYIARDVEEDDRGGRCYLPEEWLVEMDMPPGQHMKPPFRPRLTVLARRLVDRAAAFEASARVGTRRLGLRSAWAVLAAAGIYGAIGREVVARGDHAWDHRAGTSTAAKIGWIARALGQAVPRNRLYPPAPRDPDLWTRPRG
jgi:phytoene synthase